MHQRSQIPEADDKKRFKHWSRVWL
jgi:hypothetical protein